MRGEHMAKEIKVRCFISIGGAPEVPVESLTPEQRADVGIRLRDRMAAEINRYYGAHIDEWEAICC